MDRRHLSFLCRYFYIECFCKRYYNGLRTMILRALFNQEEARMDKKQFLKENCPERRGSDCSKWDSLESKYGDPDLISMWVADMDFKAPAEVREALSRKVDFGIYGYSMVKDSYYRSFIDWEKRYHGWEIKREWLRFTPGVVTGLFWLMHMLTEPGDAVMVSMPVYYPFHHAVQDIGRKLIYSELVNRGGSYSIDFADFEKKIKDSRVKVYILCSPHNPVGRVWTEEELTELLEICRRNQVKVISDEIHHDLIIGDRPHIPAGTVGQGRYADMLITLTACSKTFNLAGMKNSFLIISDETLRKQFDKLALSLHEDAGNMFGYVAAEAAYTYGRDWLETVISIIRDNYNYLSSRLSKELPKAVLSPLEGTYLAWLDLSAYLGKEGEEGMKDLIQKQARLAVDYGDWFGAGGEGFIRLNLATRPEWVEKAVDGLVAALKGV